MGAVLLKEEGENSNLMCVTVFQEEIQRTWWRVHGRTDISPWHYTGNPQRSL